MNGYRQTTLASSIQFSGIGVHSGEPCEILIEPAEPNVGILLARRSSNGDISGVVSASHSHVRETTLCTVLDVDGATVAMVEHMLSALSGVGVDNARVTISGPECPVLDGSSVQYVEQILRTGVTSQDMDRKFICVKRSIKVRHNEAFAGLEPYNGRTFDNEIDFESDAIGRQRMIFDWSPRRYCEDIAFARTFGFVKDAEELRKNGFAQGSSLENSIAIDGDRVLNPQGLRCDDEFVRHKVLDAIGDLSLAGLPIYGLFRSYKGGHRLNSMVLTALFSDKENYEVVSPDALPLAFEELRDLPESLERKSVGLRSVV